MYFLNSFWVSIIPRYLEEKWSIFNCEMSQKCYNFWFPIYSNSVLHFNGKSIQEFAIPVIKMSVIVYHTLSTSQEIVKMQFEFV